MLIPLLLCTRFVFTVGVIILVLCSACYLVLGVGLPHTPRVSMGVTLMVYFFWWGSCTWDQITFGPLPHPKIHNRDYTDGIPLNAKVSGAWQKWDGASKVCLHYTSHKMVYRHDIKWRQMYRSTHTSRMLGGLVSANSAKLQYLHGSWFCVAHVLHLSRAGQSGLPEMCHPLCLMWPCQMALSQQAHCLWMALGWGSCMLNPYHRCIILSLL